MGLKLELELEGKSQLDLELGLGVLRGIVCLCDMLGLASKINDQKEIGRAHV